MAGEVKHQWNGSILTVISDAGASSADLKGPRGETGPRGPQGPGGVIYNDDGELVIDLSPYATTEELMYQIQNNQPDLDIFATKPYVIETVYGAIPNMAPYATQTYVDDKIKPYATQNYVNQQVNAARPDLSSYATKSYVDNEIDNIDLPTYATKDYVSTEIAKAQLAEVVGDIDLSGFATKDDLTHVETKVDGKSILKDAHGNIYSTLGGYRQNGAVNYRLTELNYIPTGRWGGNGWIYSDNIGNIGMPFQEGILYNFDLTFKDGYKINFDMAFVNSGNNTKMNAAPEYADFEMNLALYNEHFSGLIIYQNGDFSIETANSAGTELLDQYILTDITIYAPGYVPIDGNFIPVDNNTIYLNENGKLACAITMDGENINLSAYYTKAEVDALIAGLTGSGGGTIELPSGEEVDY